MRRIGVIGGMSWQSSAVAYRLLNEAVAARLGGHHSARCVMSSVEFEEVIALQHAGDWDAAGELLAREARHLQDAGAECIYLATNTMHLVAPAIEAAIDVPFLHVVDVVADEADRLGVTRVGLLGTRFTMCEPFYVDLLAARGIEAIVPDCGDEVTELHRIIFDELVHGEILDASRVRYCRAMASLVERGAEAIVLGCTEIMLLVSSCDASVPVLDTTELQARAAIEFALA
jgi:aspartate racemase